MINQGIVVFLIAAVLTPAQPGEHTQRRLVRPACLAPQLRLPLFAAEGYYTAPYPAAARPESHADIFLSLYQLAHDIPYVYPFARVACGVARGERQAIFAGATNTIGTHRHAEINLVLKVLRRSLETHARQAETSYLSKLQRLEFLSHVTKLNHSPEAREILRELSVLAGEPFRGAVVYSTLRPCAACVDILSQVGMAAVYFGSEHPDGQFIDSSNHMIQNARSSRVQVTHAPFAPEQGTDPNALFFSLHAQPAYERIAETINTWFAEVIRRQEAIGLSIEALDSVRETFLRRISIVLGAIDSQTDLAVVYAAWRLANPMADKGDLAGVTSSGESVLPAIRWQPVVLFLSDKKTTAFPGLTRKKISSNDSACATINRAI